MLRFNASTQVQQQNPTWELEYIKSVLMLSIVINLVKQALTFLLVQELLFVCVC